MSLRAAAAFLLLVLVLPPRPAAALDGLCWGLDVTHRFSEPWPESQSSIVVFPRDGSLPGGSYGLAARLGTRIAPAIVTSLQYELVPHHHEVPGVGEVSLRSHILGVASEIALAPYRDVRGALLLSAGMVLVRGHWMGPDLRGQGPFLEARLAFDPFPPRSVRTRPFLGFRFSRVFSSSLRGEPAWPSPDLDFSGLVVGLSVDGVLGGELAPGTL